MNFLTFESFISIPVLIGIYYIGALFLPTLLWFQRERLHLLLRSLQKYVPLTASRFMGMAVILFLLGELFWRMIFEMLIGYFQMREYLQHLSLP